eukprot:EG_transcript_2990
MADDDAGGLPMASDDATRSECNPLLEGTITDVRIKHRDAKFSVVARNPSQTGWYSDQQLQLDDKWAPEVGMWRDAINKGPKALEKLRAFAQVEAQSIANSRFPLPVHTEPSAERNADAEGNSVNEAMAMNETQAAGQDEGSHPEHQSVPSEGAIMDVEALTYFEYFVEAKQPSETGWYSFEQLRPVEELVLQAPQWRHAAEQGPEAVAKLRAKAKPKPPGNAKAPAPSRPLPAALPQDGIINGVRGDPKESLEFCVESEELGEPGWFSGKQFRRLPREHPLKTQMQKWQNAAEEGVDAIERLRADERLRAEAKSQADATTSASPEENTGVIGRALAMNNSQLQVKSANKDKYGLSLLPSVALEKKDVSVDTSVPPAFQSFRPSEGEWYRQEFTKHPDVRPHKTLDLLQHYSHYYGMWIADLAAGNTVLLQGYGSKAPILAAFGRLPLFQQPNTVVVTASGAEPRISGRLIVNAVCSCIKGPAVAGWSLARQLHFLHQLLGEGEVQTQAAAQEAVRACCSLPEKSTPSPPLVVDGQPPNVENGATGTMGRVTPVFNNPDQNCAEGSAEAGSSPPTAAPPKRVTRSQRKLPEGACRMVQDLVDFQHAVYQEYPPSFKVKEKEVELLGGVTTRGSIDVSKPNNPRVLLCISSTDHNYLWLPSALNILATLAAMPRVWLMVTLDKVDSVATIKRRDADRFQFVCYHTPTFLPFPLGYRLTRAELNGTMGHYTWRGSPCWLMGVVPHFVVYFSHQVSGQI